MNKKIEEYDPFVKTALSRKCISLPMRRLEELGVLNGKILDYGCGHGKDIEELQLKKYDIKGYDKFNPLFNSEHILSETYDTITCNYVFNVIPSLEECEHLLQKLKSLSSNIYITVRSDINSIKKGWIYDEINKGYWTSINSFQRFYSAKDVEYFFGDIEFIKNHSDYKLFKLKICTQKSNETFNQLNFEIC